MNNLNKQSSQKVQKRLTISFWVFMLLPFIFISGLLLLQSEKNLPSIELLDNPPELQASLIIAKNSLNEDTIIGSFWLVNRTSAKYNEISPFVFDALISTEDQRFMDHSGVDFRSLLRSFTSFGGSGGASTISQQLAKLLFTLEKRRQDELAGLNKNNSGSYIGGFFGKFKRLNEKACENIIAKRLEERYTKEEIIMMYLNQFDFLYNGVGIENAARVYFDKLPKDLSKEEAALLVGMCKNPTIYNPHTYKTKNYKIVVSLRDKIPIEKVTLEQIKKLRSADSLHTIERRNQVLFQWLNNSNNNNSALKYKITTREYDSLKLIPIKINFKLIDHKEGLAPYFRESLRKEISNILTLKDKFGNLKYKKEDGSSYDIYRDGLKIYTTLNPAMQKAAEDALERHLKKELQPAFDKNNKNLKNYPFANNINQSMVNQIMTNARKSTARYKRLKEQGMNENDININFNVPTAMTVFSFSGEKDTIMTPNDSIRYYKAFLHAGLISIDPATGFVRAWVGGVNFKHFGYDHVRQGKRQVGSTIKPFVYATALSMKVVNPCTTFSSGEYCVDLVDENNKVVGKYCPSGEAAGSVRQGLAQSSNPTTVAVMARMGSFNPLNKTGGPYQIEKLLLKTNIKLNPNDVVPSMCLGSMDLSLYELVAAQCIFPNNGIYVQPTTIERITDRNGKVIYSASEEREQALNSTVAYETLKMMKGVIEGGTGSSLRSAKFGNIHPPTAGKTGTTQNNSDGWFIGITPNLVTGVWVGAEDRAVRFKSMIYGQGAKMALPIYGYYMEKVYKNPLIGLSTRDFIKPPDYDPLAYDCSEAPIFEPEDESEIPWEF